MLASISSDSECTTSASRGSWPGSAACYLRCYPADRWTVIALADAMRGHALQAGLREPAFYVDDGCPSRGSKPQLEGMIEAAVQRWITVVLVPGLWVFDLNDARACAIRDRLAAAGCRVVELDRSLASKWYGLQAGRITGTATMG